MSNRDNCKWCGYSYAGNIIKQGSEYRYHYEQGCEVEWMRKMLCKLLQAEGDHMTACDRTMGASHPCTCGADEVRQLLIPITDEQIEELKQAARDATTPDLKAN